MPNDNDKRYLRQLRIVTGSMMIVIPRELVRELGLAAGNYLSIRREGDELRVSRVHLGQDSPQAETHHNIPKGKHGRTWRNEEKEW